MKVHLKQIPAEGIHLEGTEEADILELKENQVRPVGPIEYSLDIGVSESGLFDIDAADIVGHDWGPAVAWLTATAHPDRVHKLVVLVLALALGTTTQSNSGPIALRSTRQCPV